MHTVKACRKSDRMKTNIVDYSDESSEVDEHKKRLAEWLNSIEYNTDSFPRLDGLEFDLEYLRSRGFNEPVIFERPEGTKYYKGTRIKCAGLGMKMPPAGISVKEIAEIIGDRPIEVMNGVNQEAIEGWTLFQWANYFSTNERKSKKQILNVISLEISDSPLAEMIQRPRIVRQLDWVDMAWPQEDAADKPKVQLYCLMSPEGCWTDFHVDFGGTSVFYHILSGKKIFLMIPPTRKNLEKYESWCVSSQQSTTFFASQVSVCYMVELYAGQTMMIPSGWIHGVYTPKDSIVIGGNFLHGHSIPTQLQVYEASATVVIYLFHFSDGKEDKSPSNLSLPVF